MFYKIVDSISRGKIVVATKDILPGQLIVEEGPLLHLTEDYLKLFEHGDVGSALARLLATYHTYRKVLTSVERQKFDTLFGPTAGYFADGMREFAKRCKYQDSGSGEGRALLPREIEEFVRVANVTRLNMIGSPSMGYSIFAEFTRFAHSCQSNCVHLTDALTGACSVRAVCLIATGEELTISYFGPRDCQPTHERRQRYLETKEFTCHCSRCAALGDDTRQFDCFDIACKGVMMVCQPINKEKLRLPGMCYTGVTFVEPRLLPCTVCHRAAPPSYQTQMFALEAGLAKMAEQFSARYDALACTATITGYTELYANIQASHFPRHHQLALPILYTLMHLERWYFMGTALRCDASAIVVHRERVQAAAAAYINAQLNIYTLPCAATVTVLTTVCWCCILDWGINGLAHIYAPPEAKKLLQRAMRMHLLLQGREGRDPQLDSGLLRTLATMHTSADNSPATVVSLQLCAFCEESPLRAALSLSRCGRCRQVCYCSTGCQKAHWKLHQKVCRANATLA